jgi:sugar-specific transcriptional regulator TrmB
MTTKPVFSLDDAYDDFGFSAVSEDELKSLEKQLQKEVTQKSKALEEVEKSYQGKLEQLYKAVMPLLKNLAKDSDKEYIFWPNRADKMKEFISKVEKIVND